jgi:hypothetical protein
MRESTRRLSMHAGTWARGAVRRDAQRARNRAWLCRAAPFGRAPHDMLRSASRNPGGRRGLHPGPHRRARRRDARAARARASRELRLVQHRIGGSKRQLLFGSVAGHPIDLARAGGRPARGIPMSAAQGPPCVVCGKRVSYRRITTCPRCRRVLCLKCICPNSCFGTPPPPDPLEDHVERQARFRTALRRVR